MQTKDLIVTGDVRILGNLYSKDIEELKAKLDELKIEEWTFTYEDGSTVTKNVVVK